MKTERTGWVLVVSALLSLGVGCGSDHEPPGGFGPTVLIRSPHDGATVTTFEFDIEIAISAVGSASSDPPRVGASLNGVPLPLTGGPDTYHARLQPGPPLRDQNRLVVTVESGINRVTASSDFSYLPPKAVARRIADTRDLLTGPLAHGRLGDFLLANSRARFVIQDAPQRDLYSVGTFGGNIIDAELVDRPGTDNFLELQPALNIETVIHARSVEIVNDGQDGTLAIVRACGPDDVLDFVNPSTIIRDAGLAFPEDADDADYEIEACTDYILEPGKPYVQIVTTVFNNENRDLGLFVGDYLNGSGELEQWTSSGAGLGEILTANLGVFSYIGFGQAQGVDYGLIPMPVPGIADGRWSFFATSGVSYLVASNSIVRVLLGSPATFVVPAGGSRAYTRYFSVGNGSGGNTVSLENEIKAIETGTLRGCVFSSGLPLSGSRVSVLRASAVVAPYVTGEDGCFEGALPPGSYRVVAAKRGYPYEGEGEAPLAKEVAIEAGATTEVRFDLPSTGRVRVQTQEAFSDPSEPVRPVPARVSVVGLDPSPEPIIVLNSIAGRISTGTFEDITKDTVPFGIVWLDYTDAQGQLEFELEPGEYELFVSRGTEYSLFQQRIVVAPGATTRVEATIVRVLDTPGFVSSDFHVHTINSADSRVNLTDRAYQFAGEGVDNVILTDHHSHTDLRPTIERLGLEPFLQATIGEEITTWDYGHFNAYPLRVDPSRPSGGSTDWAVGAPIGRDFPQYGSYSLTPAEIERLAKEGPTATEHTTVQINHIDSFFAPLRIDTSLVPPQTFLTPAQRFAFRLDPNGGNLFHHFKALELWNGSNRNHQSQFLDQRIGIWFNHLNQGMKTTFIADTDTHEFRNLNTAGARTWTASSTDEPPEIDPGEVARSVDAGRAVGGQGIYVQARLLAADGSGRIADFSLTGSTEVTSSRGVELEITVQAPLWAEYDRIEVYANAVTVPTLTVNDVPVLFSAVPTLTLDLGTDFQRSRILVREDLPQAARWETRLQLPFHDLREDTWFVVVVRGRDGISRPMFPVFPQSLDAARNQTLADLLDGNLDERGTLALGATNALYADVDGRPGFHAPLAP